jgi:autotransporter-associated beta strand protein
VKNVEIGGSFTFDPVGAGNTQFQDATVTLTAANPTITVLPGTGGQFILWGKITDNGAGYGFTKAGTGTLNLTPSGIGTNDYSGATTIQEGALRVIALARIGDGIGAVNLSGGQLEYNGSLPIGPDRIFTVTNPVHATANSSIAYNSVTTGLTDGTDPAGIIFEFSSNTVDRTGGTLTLVHQGASQGITYRPRFSGSGFDYAGPVVISNGGGTRKTVMESTNTTGTQTWSGDITGNGSYSRGTGGNTVLAGQLVSVGGVTIADNSKIQLAQSPGSNRVIRTANLTIGSTNSQLDLTNNKLIVPAGDIGTAPAGIYSGLTGLIQSAYNFTAWDGPGITTSMPEATTGLTTIGIATGAQMRGLGPSDTDTFAGQTINGASVIAMYTYAGDGNLDGVIDGGDYGLIDNNVQISGASGYFNGDFNYDGVIDGGDYGIIDNNIQAQGAPFPTSGVASLAEVTAVPEPMAVTLLLLPLAVLIRRRGRRRMNAGSVD